MKRNTLYTLGSIGIVLALSIFVPNESPKAQTASPDVLVNWQASSYAPEKYTGKILPTSESRISLGVDLFDQGKKINLFGQKVYWYVNEEFYQGGPGVSRITLQAPRLIGSNAIQVRVTIPEYGNGPGKTIIIPIAPPEVVLSSSAPSLAAEKTPFIVQATPYFFNIENPNELNYSWTLRNSTISYANPLTITQAMTEGGQPAPLQLLAANPNRPTERISEKIIIFQAQ